MEYEEIKAPATTISREQFYDIMTKWDNYRRDVCKVGDPCFSHVICIRYVDGIEEAKKICNFQGCPKCSDFAKEVLGGP